MKKLVFASLFLALGTFEGNGQSTPLKKKAQSSKKTAKQLPKKPNQPSEPEHEVPVVPENENRPVEDKEQPKQEVLAERKEEHPVNPQK